MGWASGGEIFDDVARSLIDTGVGDSAKRTILGRLINSLKEGDWDTLDESLEKFRDDPVIVKLFADKGVTLDCDASNGPDLGPCTRKCGHQGDHVDENDRSWSQAEVVPA